MLSACFGLLLIPPGWAQSSGEQNTVTQQTTTLQKQKPNKSPGAVHEMANGVGDAGAGAGKGAGSAAKGVAKGAGDLVTLHPIDAATDVGKGVASAGKDVAVGGVKGTGKVVKGIGKAFRHLF